MTLIKQPWETDAYFEHQSQAVAEAVEQLNAAIDADVATLRAALDTRDRNVITEAIRALASTNTRSGS